MQLPQGGCSQTRAQKDIHNPDPHPISPHKPQNHRIWRKQRQGLLHPQEQERGEQTKSWTLGNETEFRAAVNPKEHDRDGMMEAWKSIRGKMADI